MADATEAVQTLTATINALLQQQLEKSNADQQSAASTSTENTTWQYDLYNQLFNRVEKYVSVVNGETKPFEKWLRRHEYTVIKQANVLPAEMQTRLILDNLGEAEFDKLIEDVKPEKPENMFRKDLVEALKILFPDKVSITRRRLEYLHYRYESTTPMFDHIDRINEHVANFDLENFTRDDLRILLLLQSLSYSSEDLDLHLIALQFVEKHPNATLKDVVTEIEAHLRMKSLKNSKTDDAMSENSGSIDEADESKKSKKARRNNNTFQPILRCRGCMAAHYRSVCPYRNAVCYVCMKIGHSPVMCRVARKQLNAQKYHGVEPTNPTATAPLFKTTD